MSDTSILPGAAPSTESDVDMVPPGTGVEESESGGDRRRILIIGAIAGAIVLIVAAYMLLHGGSSSSTQSFVPVHPAGAAPSAAPNPSHGGSGNGNDGKTPTLPKKAKHQSVRDPFKALVTAPVSTDTGPTTTTTVKAPKTVPTTAPSAPTSSVGPTSPVSPPPSGTSSPPTTGAGPQWIQLKRIHGRTAVLDVGYRHHKFRRYAVQAPPAGSQQGTVFDKIFALIGIQNSTATIQIGDDTPFDLNKGVSHVV
jgi:hypothetical protein